MSSNLVKNIVYGVVITLLLAVQASNVLAIRGVFPDFMLILVLLHSIYFGEFKGILFGFGIGIVEDALSGSLFGLNAFVLSFLAWFTNFYKKYIQVSDIVAFLLYVTVATIIKYVLYALFNWIFQKTGFFDGYFILKLLGEIGYNIAAGALIYFTTSKLYQREEETI